MPAHFAATASALVAPSAIVHGDNDFASPYRFAGDHCGLAVMRCATTVLSLRETT